MVSSLESYAPGHPLSFHESSGEDWTPLFRQECSFPPEIFRQVMLNLIRNPNLNSNYLFRADISLESPFTNDVFSDSEIPPRITTIKDYDLKTIMVRTMIPRNMLVDKPLDQTCLFHELIADTQEIRSLVTYLPHISSAAESPFYHPAVRGIGFLHTYLSDKNEGSVSIHYSFFDAEPRSPKLERTAQHLLAVLHKHGQGLEAGYVKRVNHDVILAQSVVQNTYARLKAKYAKALITGWVEITDPGKHVFEDLSIAAFLIELWADMYKYTRFPGFVDIGCGNGLLVHILLKEGYSGWGFDARRRKSWATYSPKPQEYLQELVLVPSVIQKNSHVLDFTSEATLHSSFLHEKSDSFDATGSIESGFHSTIPGTHNGVFPQGTFIISNHADELTPWTPILANLSKSPFIMIPCCSHALSGARFRAPSPKGLTTSISAYASLVLWVSNIAKECGWEVEKEMLRIPSTRNTAIIGRRRDVPFERANVMDILTKYGGAVGWEQNAMKLIKGTTRGH
jgi:tRNASer (uridine44-2'-O)-methyltransferase